MKNVPPSSKQLLNRDISIAMSCVVNPRGKNPSEIQKYLTKYSARFETDIANGELEKVILGSPGEFEFSDSCHSTDSFIYETPSRKEGIEYLRFRQI